MFKKYISGFLSLFFVLIFTPDVKAQIDQALIQKAKAAGVTQEQIDAALANTNKIPESEPSKGNTVKSLQGNEIDRNIRDTIRLADTTKAPDRRIFGREIFSSRNLTFAPNYNIPTPPDYILAAGDEIVIDVWGASEMNVKTKISPEGSITLSGIGPVYLNGLTISQAEERVKSSLNKIMSGIGTLTSVRVTLGQIRSIKINLAGEVNHPGTYTLPSLATLFNALYSAGGVNNIGSLRSVKVYRNNKEVANLDVYDFLLNGKYDSNVRLENNDMIIIQPYQNLVSITGKIKRERTFELKKNETLSGLLEYAGGMTGDAYKENIKVKRKTGRMYQMFNVDSADYASFIMNDGDSVSVDSIINEYSNRLVIKGAVWHPGEYALSGKTDSLSKLIKIAEGLKGNEFATRGQIIRRKKDFTFETIPFNTRKITTGTEDVALMPDDEIYIPSIFDLREEYYLIVKGEVNKPDTLKYADNMTIEDAIIQCGGIKESASVDKIEVARRIKNQSEYTSRTAQIFTFNISKDLTISPQDSVFTLKPFDEIIVRNSPGYKIQKSVLIKGEVLFEGEFVLAYNGERLSDLVNKAGGLTPDSYIEGASLRRKMTEEEARKIESMQKMAKDGINKDTISLKSVETEKTYSVGINLKKALENPGGRNDIVLVEGDEVNIPKYNAVVKIKGAVLYPNAVTCIENRKLPAYLSQSGGYQSNARKKPYVVYMNGKVASTRSFLGIKHYPKIEPGCEIIVPMKPEKKDGIGLPGILGVASTSVSLASIVALLLNSLK